MIIRFRSVDDVESFLSITQNIRGDVIIGEGNIQVDGKSPMGVMGLDLNKEYPVFLHEKDDSNESTDFIKKITELGITI